MTATNMFSNFGDFRCRLPIQPVVVFVVVIFCCFGILQFSGGGVVEDYTKYEQNCGMFSCRLLTLFLQ